MSFMSTAPRPPDAPVALSAPERVDLPVGGVGGDDIGVAVHDEAGEARVGAFDADHDARAAGATLDEGGL
jgi:hypothetical protein